MMSITRRRIVRVFFTSDGHLDVVAVTHIENVRQFARDEMLVEIHPGLALLLRKEPANGTVMYSSRSVRIRCRDMAWKDSWRAGAVQWYCRRMWASRMAAAHLPGHT